MTDTSLRGVNLGGWLVLEKWITPSLFEGLKAQDETTFCLELGDRAAEVLDRHRSGYITEADFDWMVEHGVNAVRIPVGHWIFGDATPYVGSIKYLDFAFKEARKRNIQVVVVLHAAPGSQNGWDHSGRIGPIEWHIGHENIARTLDVIERLSERYADYDNLAGIELLNEPHWTIPHELLVRFYEAGYQRVRKHCDERVSVIIHDSFRPLEWNRDLGAPDYKNVVLDAHLYQCFDEQDKQLNIHQHLAKARSEWSTLIATVQKTHPMIVGEWSLGLDNSTFTGMDISEQNKALQAYANAQVETFTGASGWFFWTYKTENMVGWNYRECVRLGYLPRLSEE
ncbi:MAG: hypothetical protein JWL85_105 [Candidatus Saccharibacteria bacterium]|nr:hypothetical protein [Candidatus Saccharibacteria bacterium]